MLGPRNSSNPYRANSPQNASTVYRNQNPQSPVYYQQKQQLRQQNLPQPQLSGVMSGNPSISFGAGTASNLKHPNSTTKPIVLENGDMYQGDFNLQGEFHGYGRYYYFSKKHEYHGEFQNGRPHGRGQLYKNVAGSNNPNQQRPGMISNLILVYDGEWKNGMKNGEGKYIYNSDNHYYQGSWLNDQRHGNQGVYVSPVGKYIGKWKNGRMDGRGQFFVQKTGTNYVGNFVDNQYVNGVITYSNKDQYSGTVRNGMRQDNQGRYLYNKLNNGTQQVRFVGGWRNDMKNDQSGQATLTFPNGQTLKGAYRDGQFIDQAECTYQWIDGSLYRGWLKKVNGGYQFLKGFVKQANGKEYEV